MSLSTHTGLLLLSASFGCSVVMALSGEEDPALEILSVGQDRALVLQNLGEPSSTRRVDGRATDTFLLRFGDEPSVNRAWGYVFMDLMTLGLAELVATPGEAMQGEEVRVTVEYDGDDRVRVVDIDREKGGQLK